MKNLLILCTQNVHFSLSKEICIQNHGVVMGLPLSPTLAGSFMAQLENTLNRSNMLKIGDVMQMIISFM